MRCEELTGSALIPSIAFSRGLKLPKNVVLLSESVAVRCANTSDVDELLSLRNREFLWPAVFFVYMVIDVALPCIELPTTRVLCEAQMQTIRARARLWVCVCVGAHKRSCVRTMACRKVQGIIPFAAVGA